MNFNINCLLPVCFLQGGVNSTTVDCLPIIKDWSNTMLTSNSSHDLHNLTISPPLPLFSFHLCHVPTFVSVGPSSSPDPSTLSLSVSFYFVVLNCLTSTAGVVSLASYTIFNVVFLMPLYGSVLYVGLQKLWKQQQRSSETSCHSDHFTYQIAVIEMISVVGSLLNCLSILTSHDGNVCPFLLTLGIHLLVFNLMGEACFHVFTCVERYVAVVHPITYMSFRTAKAVQIRSVLIGFAWIMSLTWTGLLYTENLIVIISLFIFFLALLLVIISFCSLSVLRVLIRPGPGKRGGGRRKLDPKKLRAFQTITSILGVVMFRYVGYIASAALYSSPEIEEAKHCGLFITSLWVSLPSNLVLPLLFVRRAGKQLWLR